MLYRGQIRNALEKAKMDLLYKDPDGSIQILENKSFLESEFTIVGTNFSDETAIIAKRGFEEFFDRLRNEYGAT